MALEIQILAKNRSMNITGLMGSSLSLSLSLSLRSSGKVDSSFTTSYTWHSCYKPGAKSCIKKEPNNDYEKRNISVVFGDTDTP
jgi:hypothetical protein